MIELKKLSHVCINRGNAQICQKRGKNTIYCIYLILKFVVVSEDILSFTLAVIAIIRAQVTCYGISMIWLYIFMAVDLPCNLQGFNVSTLFNCPVSVRPLYSIWQLKNSARIPIKTIFHSNILLVEVTMVVSIFFYLVLTDS